MDHRIRQTVKYVTPTILSSISIFLYTIIDGIFVGRGVGSNALGAVNIAFPFIMFFTAFTMLTTIGGMAVVSVRIGRGDKEGANVAFMHSFLLTAIVCIIATIPALFCPARLAVLLGANETYIDMVAEYLFWYGIFLIPSGLCNNICGGARNDEAPALVCFATILCTSLNVVGDYFFIFPLGMGLKGAAIASGAAQTLGFFIVLPHYLRRTGILHFDRFKPDRTLMKKILLRGTPECVSQFAAPMGIMLTNQVLSAKLGDAAVNAYAVIGYAASFSAAIFIGTAEGVQPLLGRSFGEKNEDNLKYYFKAGCRISFFGSVIISAAIYLLWGQILTLFAVDGATRAVAVYAILRNLPGFLAQSLLIIINAYLYSTTRTWQALFINILRSFVLDVIVILGMPVIFGPDSIWITFGVYEGIALLIAYILLKNADSRGLFDKATE